MTSRLGTLTRAGFLALAMGGSGAAFAGPAGFMPLNMGTEPLPVTSVQWICDGSAGRPNACRNNDTGEVRSRNDIRGNEGSRYERRRDRDRDRDDDRRWRDRDRYDDYRHRRRSDDGIYFNFDVGPRYVQPAPRYVVPAPRYRVNMTRAHVQWCYDRWRSYRAYDNSYQPNYGPRRQCISPYS